MQAAGDWQFIRATAPACPFSAQLLRVLARPSSTGLLGLRDHSFDRISAEAERSLREVLRDSAGCNHPSSMFRYVDERVAGRSTTDSEPVEFAPEP
jgi:hypothetical protein